MGFSWVLGPCRFAGNQQHWPHLEKVVGTCLVLRLRLYEALGHKDHWRLLWIGEGMVVQVAAKAFADGVMVYRASWDLAGFVFGVLDGHSFACHSIASNTNCFALSSRQALNALHSKPVYV